jgi:hypothetical protein
VRDRVRGLGGDDLALLTDDEMADVRTFQLEDKHDRIDSLCWKPEASESAGCLYWLQNLTRTVDDHALAKGTPSEMPFPKKSYFPHVLRAMLGPIVAPSDKCQPLFIPKSREMMTSWLACGYIAWLCQWRPGTFYIIQTAKEDKAIELVRYIRILWENQERWLQQRYPGRATNTTFTWQNDSRVLAVPCGEDQVRMYHPFGYFMDEAAFLPEAQHCYDAVFSVARQIIAVSTAQPGWFADQCGR